MKKNFRKIIVLLPLVLIAAYFQNCGGGINSTGEGNASQASEICEKMWTEKVAEARAGLIEVQNTTSTTQIPGASDIVFTGTESRMPLTVNDESIEYSVQTTSNTGSDSFTEVLSKNEFLLLNSAYCVAMSAFSLPNEASTPSGIINHAINKNRYKEFYGQNTAIQYLTRGGDQYKVLYVPDEETSVESNTESDTWYFAEGEFAGKNFRSITILDLGSSIQTVDISYEYSYN